MLLADARTPSGSHAHSLGLENAVRDGLGTGEVIGFVRARLRTVGLTEAGLSVAALRCRERLEDLLRLDDEALARCPSPPLRQASGSLGRGLLRTAACLFPDDQAIADYREASVATPRPVAFGVLAGAGGLSEEEAALVSLHEDAASTLAAAVKLLPIDSAVASGWIAGIGEEMAELARDAVAAPEPPSLTAPLIDLRSLKTIEGRLFAS